jgi:hypothetical protein
VVELDFQLTLQYLNNLAHHQEEAYRWLLGGKFFLMICLGKWSHHREMDCDHRDPSKINNDGYVMKLNKGRNETVGKCEGEKNVKKM